MSSVQYLPPYLQTVANKRFLGATLDLLTNKPSVTRFSGFIGRQIYNGEVLSGNYLLETTPIRQEYQLEPAFITYDLNQNITSVSNFLDLLNAAANKDAVTQSWNRLVTDNCYSWQGFTDLDKIINYQNYCWVETSGNDWYWNNSIIIQPSGSVDTDIIGKVSYTDTTGITLMDGMIISFPVTQPYPFNTGTSYIVEGVGAEIVLVPVTNIITPAFVADQNNPPDYLTIAREAIDFNLWSRTNLWVNKNTINSIITILSAQNETFVAPTLFTLAERPILEFASLVLFNSGKIGIESTTYFDNSTTDAFYIVQGQNSFEVDGYQLNSGDSVIFNADHNPSIRQNIYDVNFIDTTLNAQIPRLYPVQAASTGNITLFGLQTIDGYVTQVGDRILVLGQIDATQNGIYEANNIAWTKTSEFTGTEQVGVLVLYGTVYKQTYYIFTPTTIINNPVVGFLVPTANAQIYTMSIVPDPNTLLIWDNFPLIPEVGYTVSGSTITFSSAPSEDDTLAFQAWPIGSSPITTPISGTPDGIQDGINKVFTIATPPNDSTILVWNNFPLVNGVGYTISGSTITYTEAPAPSDNLFYQYWSLWETSTPPIAQLILRNTAQNGICTLITNGDVYGDKMVFWMPLYWHIAVQNKTAINQAPLFDVFDLNNNSFGNSVVYPNSSFEGSELFSYELGTGVADTILGFPLTYGPVGNLNGVIFQNNYVTDTFSYTNVTVAEPILAGRSHLIDPISKQENIFDPWQYVESNLELYQNYLTIGNANIGFSGTLLAKAIPNSQATQVYVGGVQIPASDFVVMQNNEIINVEIASSVGVSPTDEILIKILSSTPIPGAWYDVPPAFELNPLGQQLTTFNMGQLRLHASTSQANANDTTGIVNLLLNEYAGVPGSILFQESISMLPTLLLCNKTFDIDQSLRAAADDYNLFKQRFLNTAIQLPNAVTAPTKQSVDQVLQTLALTAIDGQPWATSDMCYWGGTTQNITINNTHLVVFNLQQTYDFTQANNQALLVYRNETQMILGQEYKVSGNVLTILIPLNIGDIISIYEIENTIGSYIPATPTKLGLFQSYVPQIYTDYTYQSPRQVLQGHDGSITTCYGDFRDAMLLDYELRVFNNLKVNNQLISDTIQTYVPNGGRWRSGQAPTNASIAPYTDSELLTIQQRMFYEWTAEYNVNYVNSFYEPSDLFTWNWSSCLDKLSNHEALPGYWRGIYRWFYDTENVNTSPWESLGLTIKPIWWDTTYGVSPYTGGNSILWDDIAAGIIRDPEGIRYSSFGTKTFGANSVTSVIPVDDSGNLIDPNECVVGVFNDSSAPNDFVFGDDGPGEETWRRSSVFPFAKLRAQILQNPLFMCGTLWDTNNYLPTEGFNQFRYQENYLGSIDQVTLNSVDNNGTATVNSLLNYSIEYMRRQGQNPNQLREAISNTIVQLMYPLGGFSSAADLTAFGTPDNPADVGAAELIPVQDYSLFLNQSTPTGTLNYSGLIISLSEAGTFQVTGYNSVNPFFTIYPINDLGPSVQIGVSPNFYRYPKTTSGVAVAVPYNTVFPDVQSVINFIAGYAAYLTNNGLSFINNTAQTQVDWQAAAIQFIKWSLTDWNLSTPLSLVLNPSSSIMQYNATSGTLYDLTDPLASLVLDVNGAVVTSQYLDVYRDVNSVTITHQGGGIFSCIEADIVNYEQRVVFDNITAFDDTIYDPISGIRQNRLTFSGQKSADWNGTLDSPGFLICTNSVQNWIPNKDYLFGSLVQWKNNNYVATQDVIGSQTFPYAQFQLISTIFTNSILPNLSLKSVDYLNAYNINYRPFMTDLMGLRNNTIGYIERDWLSILDIDQGGQTDFYKGWIKEKGSLNSVLSYARGSTPNLNTVVDINEEYAMKVGVYGTDLSTGYGEVSLPPAINTQNPLVISFVNSPNTLYSNSIQVTPNSLYEKSSNWNNDFIQYCGNLALETKNFMSGGPVIPQIIIDEAAKIPGFVNTDEPYLFFSNIGAMTTAPQNSILKLAENGGNFWVENNQLVSSPNQWDVITFSSVSTGISSISQLNSNTICFILTTDISATANSVVVINYNDASSNISIAGAFLVNDYFIAPFRTANAVGYSNLTITTTTNQFGNVFINYQLPVMTSDVYISRSLRANSIAEATEIASDTTQYVVNDKTGEAAYNLTIPYQTEITYPSVPSGVPISSLAYDMSNEIVWVGKPSAVPSGIVDLRVVGSQVLNNGNIVPTFDSAIYSLQPRNPNSSNFGKVISAANNLVAASADAIGLPGQVYIAQNAPFTAPVITQILNGNTSTPYIVSELVMSADSKWLYTIEQSSGNVSNIGVYSLQNNANIGQSWFPYYTVESTISNTSITVDEVIPSAYAITVEIINNVTYSARILIPEYEYTVSGNIITINVGNAGITNVGDANSSVYITGISQYYEYQGTIVPSEYGLSLSASDDFGYSIACDATGQSLVVGVPSLGNGNVVVFNRIVENQYANASSFITPINSFQTITAVMLDGLEIPPTSNVFVSTTGTVTFEGFCFAVTQVIPAPNGTDSGFGESVAIQNNQIVIGSPNTPSRNQYRKGTVYLYALDSAITSTKIIPMTDLIFSTSPLMINNWVIAPSSANISGLLNAINITTGYTGISAYTQNSNLVLTINPTLQTSGIGLLGA